MMTIKKSGYWVLGLCLIFCISYDAQAQYSWIGSPWAEQAHRGGAALYPENTILAHQNAVKYNSCLELDLQMSKDKKLVVSHDPYLDGAYCLTPEGDTMDQKQSKTRLIYEMDYDSIARYDCGSKFYSKFPDQKKVRAVRPKLEDLIDSVESYGKRIGNIPYYDIEIKSNPKWDGVYYPSLDEYIDSAMNMIIRKGIANRTMIQSFDARAMKIIHDKWPNIITYYLKGSQKGTLDEYLSELDFIPDYLEVNHPILSQELIDACHKKGIRILTATVNEVEEMQKFKNMGVDGIISDYPNLYSELK